MIDLLKIRYERNDNSYEHTLPNPSKFTITYADVDKEGSGRNEETGEMYRERIGHYQSFDVQWDIIPNTALRSNLIRVLRNLPPKFTLIYHDSDDTNINSVKEMECYRSDISEGLYVFTEKKQIWQGLSTSFIQFDVIPYDDDFEPSLLNGE